MTTETEVTLAALVLIVGFLYSCVGHAGASGYIAALTLVGMSNLIKGSPIVLVLNVLVSTIGTIQFARAGHFSWRLFWPFAATSIPMAYAGGLIKLPPEAFKPIIGAVLLFSAWRIVAVSFRPVDQTPKPPTLPIALVAGGILGFVAGLTTTGGGIFLSPLMLLMGWAEPKRVSAVAAPFILVNSLAGLAGLFTAKSVVWPTILPVLCVMAVIGGFAGSYLGSRKMDKRMIRRVLAVVLVIAGGMLIREGIALLLTKWHPPQSQSERASLDGNGELRRLAAVDGDACQPPMADMGREG